MVSQLKRKGGTERDQNIMDSDTLKNSTSEDLHHLLTHSIKGEVKVFVSPFRFFVTPGTVARQAPLWNSPGENTGVGSHSLLQGIFPTQGSNPGLLHCRQIPYYLSHQGSSNQGDVNFQDIPRSKFWPSMPVPAPSRSQNGV